MAGVSDKANISWLKQECLPLGSAESGSWDYWQMTGTDSLLSKHCCLRFTVSEHPASNEALLGAV